MTAVLSAKPFDPAVFLAEKERSLLRQADAVTGVEQGDGWGAAFYSAHGPRCGLKVVKSPGPAFAEKARFTRTVSGVRSGLALAHIRRASNPRGLPAKRLLGVKNTQPFHANGFVFAHNGTLEIPEEIKTTLGKYEKFVRGINDSEILFWQVMKMLDAYGAPAQALEMAVEEIKTVWLSCKNLHSEKKAPYRGLNIFLSNGKSLWVLCHFRSELRALMTPGWESGRIAWRKDEHQVVFSSEPLDRGAWNKMSDLDIAEAALTGSGVSLNITNIGKGSK
jgi:predicted glutamine amidotransferase